MDFKRIDDRAFVEALRAKAIGPRADYKAFYSSFLGGITTEPHHMVVPIDVHMVHRGDAVFEAIKFHDGGIFALDRHLERLEKSAQTVGFSGLWSRPQMVAMISETVRVSELRHGLIRLIVARGPGGFTTNPYETIGTQVYCAVTKLAPPPAEKYVSGVRVGQSAIAHLGECVAPEALDVPYLSAVATVRRLRELDRRHGKRTPESRTMAWRVGVGR